MSASRRPSLRATGPRAYLVREAAELALVVVGLVIASRFVGVPLWAWIGIPVGKAILSVAWYGLVLRRTFTRQPASGPQALIGETGTALTALRPIGHVKIRSEIWHARSGDESEIHKGAVVRVSSIEGHTAVVSPIDGDLPH